MMLHSAYRIFQNWKKEMNLVMSIGRWENGDGYRQKKGERETERRNEEVTLTP
jgi:hypothetical protein